MLEKDNPKRPKPILRLLQDLVIKFRNSPPPLLPPLPLFLPPSSPSVLILALFLLSRSHKVAYREFLVSTCKFKMLVTYPVKLKVSQLMQKQKEQKDGSTSLMNYDSMQMLLILLLRFE